MDTAIASVQCDAGGLKQSTSKKAISFDTDVSQSAHRVSQRALELRFARSANMLFEQCLTLCTLLSKALLSQLQLLNCFCLLRNVAGILRHLLLLPSHMVRSEA